MNEFVHDQLLELIVRHVSAGQNLRFIDGVLAAEQQLDNLPALIEKVYEITYGKWVLQIQ